MSRLRRLSIACSFVAILAATTASAELEISATFADPSVAWGQSWNFIRSWHPYVKVGSSVDIRIHLSGTDAAGGRTHAGYVVEDHNGPGDGLRGLVLRQISSDTWSLSGTPVVSSNASDGGNGTGEAIGDYWYGETYTDGLRLVSRQYPIGLYLINDEPLQCGSTVTRRTSEGAFFVQAPPDTVVTLVARAEPGQTIRGINYAGPATFGDDRPELLATPPFDSPYNWPEVKLVVKSRLSIAKFSIGEWKGDPLYTLTVSCGPLATVLDHATERRLSPLQAPAAASGNGRRP